MRHAIMITAILMSVLGLSRLADAKGLTFNPRVGKIKIEQNVNYDKLCKAIAVAETSGCTKGSAITKKNCHGIMAWDKNGNRFTRYFKSYAASQQACVAIWKDHYVKFPNYTLAKRWTGGDKTSSWLAIVTQKYNTL